MVTWLKKDGFVNLSDEKVNGKSSCFLMFFEASEGCWAKQWLLFLKRRLLEHGGCFLKGTFEACYLVEVKIHKQRDRRGAKSSFVASL